MALSASEVSSGGFVRDLDGRLITGSATGQGRGLLFLSISTAAAGQTLLVAANATLKIKVVSYVIVASAAVTVKFQSGNTDLTGAMALAANGGISAVGQPSAHVLETIVNNALNINLGGAVQVSGHLSYFLEA